MLNSWPAAAAAVNLAGRQEYKDDLHTVRMDHIPAVIKTTQAALPVEQCQGTT